MSDPIPAPAPTIPWLVRIPLIFASLVPELFRRMGVSADKKLGPDYYLVRIPGPSALQLPEADLLISWNVPVHHMWPCDPEKTRNFVEKSSLTLVEKFGGRRVQTVLIGPLDADPSQRYFRSLASNLRGRVLQIFPDLNAPTHDAEAQDAQASTLFCLVGREGLYAGAQSPKACGGFHPGGTKFIKQRGPGAISRAGAKIAEALHFLLLHRPALPEKSHWLDLGASPGGMTSELLARGHRVTAVDRAPLDERLRDAEGLTFLKEDVAAFRPRKGQTFDAILCDLNGDPMESLQHAVRLSASLGKKGMVIFTLKMPGAQTLPEILALSREVTRIASSAGLSLIAQTHLSYNRHEFTLFFERAASR